MSSKKPILLCNTNLRLQTHLEFDWETAQQIILCIENKVKKTPYGEWSKVEVYNETHKFTIKSRAYHVGADYPEEIKFVVYKEEYNHEC